MVHIIRDVSSCPREGQGAVVALGNFDGVHRGHRAILTRCLEIAKQHRAPAAVMSFEPHPRAFFQPGTELRLEPFRAKAERLRALGIDLLFLMRFNQRLASLSAASFVEEMLAGPLAVRHIVTGDNFAFGKGRQGNTSFLAEAARRLGFGYTTCPPVHDEAGAVISSSAIRRLLAAGDMATAAALLGRPYEIAGRARPGAGRGRGLGFATANLSLNGLCKPRFGVYAVRTEAGGAWHNGVANLGVRPTFGGGEALLEAHLFDMEADLRGVRLRVQLVEFIRDEKKFEAAQALAAQIAQDCEKARRMLALKGKIHE